VRRVWLALALAVLAVAAVFRTVGGPRGCPPPREAKRVADAFVTALVQQDGGRASRYLNADAEALRNDMPSAYTGQHPVTRIVRRAKQTTVEACSLGFLAVVDVPRNDPCFVYPLSTSGGGWLLAGRSFFEGGDFRVMMGCDGGNWGVEGTIRHD
jgi:hypothetical protein